MQFDMATCEPRNLVEYILLAEFDIDTGSTLRCQFPSRIDGYSDDWFAENMLPEGAHNRDLDTTYIFLNRNSRFNGCGSNFTRESDQKCFLYGVNIVMTKHDTSVRRGAIVKAIAFFSPYHYIEEFKNMLESALENYYENPSIAVLENLYTALNSVDLSSVTKVSTRPIDLQVMRRGVSFNSLHAVLHKNCPTHFIHPLPSIKFLDQSFEISLPLYRGPWEFGNTSITNLVKMFGESTMKIFHGLLTNQRIIFVGYNQPTNYIGQMVLSSVAMVSPPIPSVIKRTYAYANLADLTFLEVPGYIAGVTNPMFQQKDSWWDLVCVLDMSTGTGTVQSADEKRLEDNSSRPKSTNHNKMNTGGSIGGSGHNNSSTSTSPLPQHEINLHVRLDQKFIQSVISGIKADLDEHWVQQQFYEYTMKIVQQAQDKVSNFHIANRLQKSISSIFRCNDHRASVLSTTREFLEIESHPWLHKLSALDNLELPQGNAMPSSPSTFLVSDADSINLEVPTTGDLSRADSMKTNDPGKFIRNCIRILLNESDLGSQIDLGFLFKNLDEYLTNETDFRGLLYLLPEPEGGLYVIASGLLHSSPVVRFHVTRIILRLCQYESISSAFHVLGRFFKSAFLRQKQRLLSGELELEVKLLVQSTIFNNSSLTNSSSVLDDSIVV